MKRSIYLFIALLLAGGMLSALGAKDTPKASGLEPAAANITAADMLAHIKKLSSDEFEGRSPATKGEELTINYLADNFKKLGLKPGNPDGTYFQKVPLLSYQVDTNSEMTFTGKSGAAKLKFRDDYVAWTRQLVDTAAMNGELVFVGYGAVAPEYQWDDFKGQDLKGKIVVLLINDPPLPDDKMFGGRAMTYYGRWTYKFEIAAQKGAAGCLIVHETEPASYGWDVVKNSWGDGGFTIENPQKNRDLLPVEGWITLERAQELFKLAGKDFSEAKKAALSRDFKPIPLGVTASVSLKNSYKKIDSHNVIAKLEGSDPKLKDEYVIFTAHWDHFGIGNPVNGDKIYNGARDNASGTAGLLELAKAYSKLPHPPKRSLLFLAVTAEERGLLGSAYYGENPLYPHNKTVAVINMDSLNIWGRTKDITVVGYGNSSLDDYVKSVATKQGRIVKPDPQPERGAFYRSDHFSFAKKGVPALDPGAGIDFVGKPAEWSTTVRKNYNENTYHKPSDEVTPDWDLSGAVEDLQLLFQVGFEVANAKDKPTWNEGNEFKAIREDSLKKGDKH